MLNKKNKIVFLFLIFLSSYNIKYAQADAYLATAEVMPAPVGGLPAIYSKVKYPNIAKQAGIQGTVFVMALVNENGEVDDVVVLEAIGGGCAEAAVDAIKKTKFTPGEVKGQKVKVKVVLPIIFKLK